MHYIYGNCAACSAVTFRWPTSTLFQHLDGSPANAGCQINPPSLPPIESEKMKMNIDSIATESEAADVIMSIALKFSMPIVLWMTDDAESAVNDYAEDHDLTLTEEQKCAAVDSLTESREWLSLLNERGTEVGWEIINEAISECAREATK